MKRLCILILFALASVSAAPAAEVRPLSASPSAEQLKGACDAAGGEFHTDAELGLSTGGYGCTRQNCDGEGGNCIVACDGGGSCTGQTPDRIGPQVYTLVAIMQNGDPTIYYHGAGVGSTAGQSSAGGSGGNQGGENVYTPHPVNCTILPSLCD